MPESTSGAPTWRWVDSGDALMINPTSDVAKELVLLAERMGIPTEDATRRVVKMLNEMETADEARRVNAQRA